MRIGEITIDDGHDGHKLMHIEQKKTCKQPSLRHNFIINCYCTFIRATNKLFKKKLVTQHQHHRLFDDGIE